MRDYGKVSPKFWTGASGKALRGHMEAQIVALYLMTSPHANMIGVYTLPVLYIAHETGLTIEGALKGLAECIEGGFCTYDEASETVFVVEMAAHQVGEELKHNDNRVGSIAKQYLAITESRIRAAFHARYATAFHLPPNTENARGGEAPSKPLQSQKQDQEQEQKQERASPSGSRLPADWSLPDDWRQWAQAERPDVDVQREASCFADYWHGIAGAKGRKADWEATWRNWIRRADTRGGGTRGNAPREPTNLRSLTA